MRPGDYGYLLQTWATIHSSGSAVGKWLRKTEGLAVGDAG
jgi:hypothetical protein